ncbi:hypothetical protein BC828DRAFT_372431 [Blastocladiella britannica]|nr:hypothetical protein BC828DRAFT_372431 [Blastocladiella britannica]
MLAANNSDALAPSQPIDDPGDAATNPNPTTVAVEINGTAADGVNGNADNAAAATTPSAERRSGDKPTEALDREVSQALNVLGANANPTASTLTLTSTVAVSPDHDDNDRKHVDAVTQRRRDLQAALLDRESSSANRLYWSSSAKEEKALKYVDNFRQQYTTLYPHRTELLLSPFNEFGIRKFVCTTIRPTQLGFKELYEYRTCARFVADYISYQPLDPPYEMPSKLPSPSYTLALQVGNCFDMSVLLVSLLRGAGYDAFVVSGYASRTLTLMDETHIDMDPAKLLSDSGFDLATDPLKPRAQTATAKPAHGNSISHPANSSSAAAAQQQQQGTGGAGDPTSQENAPKYVYKSRSALKSKYMATMEAKKKVEDERRKKELHEKLVEQYTTNDDDDEIAGLRVHAWVLVLPGKRDIAEAFFVEPSTGKVYDLEDPNYLGVESVFSSNNYWVNMQKCMNGLKGISFDLGDTTKWEYIFIQNSQPTFIPPGSASGSGRDAYSAGGANGGGGGGGGGGGSSGNHDGGDDDEDAENADGDTEIFDLPPSWVSKLVLSKDQFAQRCPSGSKVQTWRNAKLELFAPYHRPDGMVARVTLFADPRRAVRGAIHERFENRKDKLNKRIRIPSKRLQHEYFDRGRPHALMEHVTEQGRTTRMRFFAGARSDGLFDREELGTKVIEHFEGREDRLVYRSATREFFGDGDDDSKDAANGGIQAIIVKMTEKFAPRQAKAQPAFPFLAFAKLIGHPSTDSGDNSSNNNNNKASSRARTPGGTSAPAEEAREDDEETASLQPRIVPPGTPAYGLFGGREVSKRVFLVRDERIRFVYHTEPGSIVQSWREFRKPSPEQKTTFSDLTSAFDTRLSLHSLKKQHLYAKLCELIKAEQTCLQAVKSSEREMADILSSRQTEEKNIQLTISLLDTIRNKTDIASELEKESQKQAEEASKEASVDYLSPFLLNVRTPSSMSKDEANAVRESCLRSLRERLVEKSNIIQRRYEEETAAYQRRQQQYSKNAEGMTPQETDEYVTFCNEALFRIHVLEKRLARHKEAAPEIYLALDRRLKVDPRLTRAGV